MKDEKANPRLLRTREAAAYLGISAWSLRNLVYGEQIPVVQLADNAPFLFDVRDLDAFIERHKRTG